MEVVTILWLVWIGYFVILEAYTIWKGGTLSAHVWTWFGVHTDGEKPNKWDWFRRVVLALFMIWLTVHWVTGVI